MTIMEVIIAIITGLITSIIYQIYQNIYATQQTRSQQSRIDNGIQDLVNKYNMLRLNDNIPTAKLFYNCKFPIADGTKFYTINDWLIDITRLSQTIQDFMNNRYCTNQAYNYYQKKKQLLDDIVYNAQLINPLQQHSILSEHIPVVLNPQAEQDCISRIQQAVHQLKPQ